MKSKQITILHLYARDMNIYGDRGNVLCLMKRLEWYGYQPKLIEYNQGEELPADIDIVVGGGGQDSGQTKIREDLVRIGSQLIKLANQGVPMLMICGLYQLFGKFFKTMNDEIIEGIGLFDAETYGRSERLIGNIVTSSDEFGDIVGYENHSGQTFLGNSMQPLGIVKRGAGNNLTDSGEGARYKNVIGTYMHGSLLPKNPNVADFLIAAAIKNRYNDKLPEQINGTYTEKARLVAIKRPR